MNFVWPWSEPPIDHWACIFYLPYISIHCTRSPNNDGKMFVFATVKGHFVYFLTTFSLFLPSRPNEIANKFSHFPIKLNVYTPIRAGNIQITNNRMDRISWQHTHNFFFLVATVSIAFAELMTLLILIVCWFWPLTCFRFFVGILFYTVTQHTITTPFSSRQEKENDKTFKNASICIFLCVICMLNLTFD